MSLRWCALTLLLAAAACPALASAQRTGGSFGRSSSSWSRSSSSSSSSRSSGSTSFGSSSTRSHDLGSTERSWSGSLTTSSSREPSGPSRGDLWRRARRDQEGQSGGARTSPAERAALRPRAPLLSGWQVFAGLWILLFGLTWVLPADWVRLAEHRFLGRRAATPGPVWLWRVSLGFDWTVREALQRDLHALSLRLSIETDRERASAVHEMLALLRRHHRAVRYARVESEELSARQWSGRVQQIAVELRSRFQHETRGARASAEADPVPRPEEGPGMLVVSVIVATRSPLRRVEVRDRQSARLALDPGLGETALGLEMVWSPAEPNDRMSSYELERFYPELQKLPNAGDVGSISCPHCGAPRPAELARCPGCGSEARS